MCKGKGRPVTRQYGYRSGIEVQPHSCLTSVIDGSWMSMPRSDRFTPLWEPQYTYWVPKLSQILCGNYVNIWWGNI